MNSKSSEKIKLYAVIGLSIIAVIMAYVRFGPKPSRSSEPTIESAVVESAYGIPELPDWLAHAPTAIAAERLPDSSPIRDLFAPAEEAPVASTTRPPRSAGLDGQPFLSAIMTGRQGALAVIDENILRVGEQIGKYTVAEIGRRHVVLRDGDTSLVLQVGK